MEEEEAVDAEADRITWLAGKFNSLHGSDGMFSGEDNSC